MSTLPSDPGEDEPRILEPKLSPDDAEFDRSLRPKTLTEFVGQTDVSRSYGNSGRERGVSSSVR